MRQSSVVVVLGSGAEPSGDLARATRLAEILRMIAIFRNADSDVTLASRTGESIVFAGGTLEPTHAIADIDETHVDALVVVDGPGVCYDLSSDPVFARLIRRFDVTPRPLALAGSAVDAVGRLRRSDGAPMLRNRRVAVCACAAERIRASGAEPLVEAEDAEHVSIDTYLLTAQNTRSLATLARIVATYFGGAFRRRAARAS